MNVLLHTKFDSVERYVDLHIHHSCSEHPSCHLERSSGRTRPCSPRGLRLLSEVKAQNWHHHSRGNSGRVVAAPWLAETLNDLNEKLVIKHHTHTEDELLINEVSSHNCGYSRDDPHALSLHSSARSIPFRPSLASSSESQSFLAGRSCN